MPIRGVLLLVAALLAVAAPASATEAVPRPVLSVDFPDPAVVATGSGLVAYSTGDLVPHAWSRSADGPWRRGPGLLTHKPSWSRSGGIWAVDVARVRGTWLLYYATPVPSLGATGRCIGVARSDSALGPFRPVGRRPLVCPRYARVPIAQDPLVPRDRTLPRAGVIDPSFFRDADGTPYLLYKTDRLPSTVRIVPLSPTGESVAPGATSIELVRSAGVLENPVVTQRPEGYVMLASEGDWTRCGYATTWRISASLLDWTASVPTTLLDNVVTPLCGPGGADLVEGLSKKGGGRTLLFLHGWTCRGTDRPCVGRGKWDHKPRQRGIRAMYAAELGWAAGVPQVTGWLRAP